MKRRWDDLRIDHRVLEERSLDRDDRVGYEGRQRCGASVSSDRLAFMSAPCFTQIAIDYEPWITVL